MTPAQKTILTIAAAPVIVAGVVRFVFKKSWLLALVLAAAAGVVAWRLQLKKQGGY